jgi:hypothetical protein
VCGVPSISRSRIIRSSKTGLGRDFRSLTRSPSNLIFSGFSCFPCIICGNVNIYRLGKAAWT